MSLNDYRTIWNRKPALRAIYADFYERIAEHCVPGRVLEIGGGIGNLKQRLPTAMTTDVQYAPWLDCVADAHRLPFAAGTLATIVMVDVLHHLEHPATFFQEAERVLQSGGRIVMVEPAITWGSTLFYRVFHQEPVRTSANPLTEGIPDPSRDPYHSNQAIPTLIATRDGERFHRMFPTLKIRRVEWFSFLVYALSGGFRSWTLVPRRFVRGLLEVEHAIEPWAGRLAGFRMMLIVEKLVAP